MTRIRNLRKSTLRDCKCDFLSRLISCEPFLSIFFRFVIPTKPRTISLTNRIIYKLSKLFLSEFIFLHSFRKIYINIKTREVTINVNGKQEKILKRYYNFRNYNYNLLSRKYFITKESLDKIHDIISVRDQENCLNVIRRHS